ncbi:MAG: hypothetical protein ACQXXL_03430 [Candidatus Methanosuratincola sp.]|jgi:hypothetical protein
MSGIGKADPVQLFVKAYCEGRWGDTLKISERLSGDGWAEASRRLRGERA